MRRDTCPRVLVLSFAFVLAAPALRFAQCEVELQKLVAPDPGAGAGFGLRVALDGDVAAVGAFYDDDVGADSGSAYVFARDANGAWTFVKKLLASDGAAADYFGFGLAVAGDTVFVGAPGKTGSEVGQGALYVFRRDQGGAGNWGEVTKLLPATAGADAEFGRALDVLGDLLLVGSPGDGVGPGAGYLYRRDPATGSWNLEQKLASADPATAANFGYSVALGDDAAFLSSGERPRPSTFVVHVRERDAGGADHWGEVTRIASPTGNGLDYFAEKVVADGDLLVATCAGEFDLDEVERGAAYLFARDQGGSGQWGLVKRFFSTSAEDGAFIAEEVALAGDWLVAGLPYEPLGEEHEAGTILVFGRHVGGRDAWGELVEIHASDAAEDDYFGIELALQGDRLLVGAPEEYFFGPTAGSAYELDLARLARATWRNADGSANPESFDAGRPLLGATWVSDVDLATTDHANAALVVFREPAEIALGAGRVLLGRPPVLAALSPVSLVGSVARFETALPLDAGLCGLELTTQALHFGGGPFALSNAQDLVLGTE